MAIALALQNLLEVMLAIISMPLLRRLAVGDNTLMTKGSSPLQCSGIGSSLENAISVPALLVGDVVATIAFSSSIFHLLL
ncbi:hypothetical protein Tco_1144455 [Tanacetum coccineum]